MEISIHISNCSLPIPFIKHAFIVLTDGSIKHRYEVLHVKNSNGSYKGTYIHKDTYPLDAGIPVFHTYRKKFWKSTCIFNTKITMNLVTSSNFDFGTFEKILHEYPHKYTYGLWCKNSHSFISWVLDRLSISFGLPWNCIGK